MLRLKICSPRLNPNGLVRRGFAAAKSKCETTPAAKAKKSESAWGFFSAAQEAKAAKKKEMERCCPPPKPDEPDPDLSALGGQPYKSCGDNTYVIQREMQSESRREMSHEELALRKIESEPNMKSMVTDPMPPFRSVEQRMLDLSERKLHPFYKRYVGLQRHGGSVVNPDCNEPPPPVYQSRSGPLSESEIPTEKFKMSRELLERKNIFSDFKTVQLPRQLVARMAEMTLNRRPTLERKRKEDENTRVGAKEKDKKE